MNLVGAGDGFRVCLRQADIAYFPRLHELSHSTDRFLDRCFGVHTMLIVEIDVIDAEPFEAGSDEFRLLELYLMSRANGLKIETPAVRF